MAPIVVLALAACSAPAGENTANLLEGPGEDGVLFLAQRAPPNAVMEALFDGRIAVDRAGCLRLDTQDRHTVVWPFGFSLDRRVGGLVVLDDGGADVGRIGGSFRFGGGEVPTLHDGIPLSAEDMAQAESRCPGRYWIVGEV